MSEYGVEGSPEQETNTKEDNPHAIDKWAQEVTTDQSARSVGPLGVSRPAYPWAPPPSGSTWRSPIGCLWRFDEAQLQLTPWLPPINTKGEG